MFQFILQWLLTTIAFMIVVNAVPGYYQNPGPWAAMLLAVFIGVLNAGLGAALRFITAPAVLIIFCVFVLCINAVFILAASQFIPGFYVEGTDPALWGGVVICSLAIIFRMAGGHEGKA